MSTIIETPRAQIGSAAVATAYTLTARAMVATADVTFSFRGRESGMVCACAYQALTSAGILAYSGWQRFKQQLSSLGSGLI